ncbi:hypothetical protein B0H13DRAFT_2284757 [Mycena leptocephala]|nr:hypothetical protein B0H13DRAFT_2284757 [Mycena leptocephala]
MLNSERAYIDLIFSASGKYACWDPEIEIKVGDWGRVTRGKRGLTFWRKKGTFLKEGNIFVDGKAKRYRIPEPIEYGGGSSEGETWIVSQNAKQIDIFSAVGVSPAVAQCRLQGAFEFSSGRGAVLVMENDMISCIEPQGALRRLLKDPTMRGFVVVSQVHSCSSYARILTAQSGGTIALGLSIEPPVSGTASATANATWVRSVASGNFRSRVNKDGHRKFYPLFRLVSLKEEAISTTLEHLPRSRMLSLPGRQMKRRAHRNALNSSRTRF